MGLDQLACERQEALHELVASGRRDAEQRTRASQRRPVEAAKKLLAEKGYDPSFGARPLKRLIQDIILNPLAMKLLEGEIKEDSTVKIGVKDGEVTVA